VFTVADGDAVPPETTTTAARAPTLSATRADIVTVSVVSVEALTVPSGVAPAAGVNVTTLLPAVVASKPVPTIVNVAASEGRFDVSSVNAGVAGQIKLKGNVSVQGARSY
jgi:hypothetical protein